MKNRLLGGSAAAALLFAVGSIPAAALMTASPTADQAANGCGSGWYFNTYTQSCAAVGAAGRGLRPARARPRPRPRLRVRGALSRPGQRVHPRHRTAGLSQRQFVHLSTRQHQVRVDRHCRV